MIEAGTVEIKDGQRKGNMLRFEPGIDVRKITIKPLKGVSRLGLLSETQGVGRLIEHETFCEAPAILYEGVFWFKCVIFSLKIVCRTRQRSRHLPS